MSEKSANALRTIGEVAEDLGLEPHVLRFWETKFKQIKPQKRRGRRYYRPQDVKLVSVIKSLLYTQGFTIKGAQRFLKQNVQSIDDSAVLELTESMAVNEAEASSDVKKEQSVNSQPSTKTAADLVRARANLRAASPASQLQPSLFAFQKAAANEAQPEESSSVASPTESNGGVAKAGRMSDADKRRLREIYRGLCYTKEKLDETALG